jgi:hypothetical protein
MKRSTVPNAVLLVMDPQYGVIPELMDGGLIAASRSCVAIGTIADSDCEVEIGLGNRPEDCTEAETALHCVYRGPIATPRRVLSVCSVYLEELVTTKVAREKSDVEIWVNDDNEPDQVIIVVRE